MNRQAIRNFLPAIILFIILNSGILVLTKKLEGWGFDPVVMTAGNLILFATILISYLMRVKALQTKNNYAFFRLVYGSFIIKLIFLAAAAFIYIMVMKKNVNKPGLFFCMGLYLLYTFIEVNTLMKISKPKTNA